MSDFQVFYSALKSSGTHFIADTCTFEAITLKTEHLNDTSSHTYYTWKFPVTLLMFALVFPALLFGQGKDSSIFNLPIQIDEVTIRAARGGWDIEGFIKRVKTDTTFYKAFRALHLVPYRAVNDIKILDKNGGAAASLNSQTEQLINGRCRSMKVLEEKTTGDFYKRNGEYRYYTAALYGSLFFTKPGQQVCGENDIVAGRDMEAEGKGSMEKNKAQLKQLIFNPGSPVKGVPFVGNKAGIFEPDIAKMYNFKLQSVDYDGQECYLFEAIPKPEFASQVVYNELSTWFRKSDYAIVARNYSLSYHTVLFDFDVRMKVRLQSVNGRLLPSSIDYNGNWYAFTKGRERSVFRAVFSY